MFAAVIERWRKLCYAQVDAIERYLFTGDAPTLATLAEPATGANQHWLLEDLLAALPDPPAWNDEARRLMHVLAVIERRPGLPPVQQPLVLLGAWLASRIPREPPDADWFGTVVAALALPRDQALSLALCTQPLRSTSAARYLLAATDGELVNLLGPLLGMWGIPLLLQMLAGLAPERLIPAVDFYWKESLLGRHPQGRAQLLTLLLSTDNPRCRALALDLCARTRVPEVEATLAALAPDRFPPAAARQAAALEDLRRYRRADSATLDAIAAYLRDGERGGLAAVAPLSTRLFLVPWAEALAQALSLPEHMTLQDQRALDVLVSARAAVPLVRWAERATLVETPGQDGFGAARDLLLERGFPPDELTSAVMVCATYFARPSGQLNSLGRFLQARTPAEIEQAARMTVVERRWGMHSILPWVRATDRVENLLAALAGMREGQSAHQVKWHCEALLADAPERAAGLLARIAEQPTSLLPEGTLHADAAWRLAFDAALALVAYRRAPYLDQALGLARARLADAKHSPLEVIPWLIRTLGGEALPELLALLDGARPPLAHDLALQLVGPFGPNAWPALECLLAHEQPYFRQYALGQMIAWRDAAHDPRIEQELARLLDDKDLRAQRQAIDLLERWGFARLADRVFALLESTSAQVRHRAAKAVLKGDFARAIAHAERLLAHKQAAARLGGITVLELSGDPRAAAWLEARLEREPSEDVREAILLALRERWRAEGRKLTWPEIERRIARTRPKGQLAPWLDVAKLPPLHLLDGQRLDEPAVAYLLHRQARVRGVREDIEAAALYELVDRKSSGDFALALLDGFLAGGGAAEESWALAIAGRLGDARVVSRLVKAVATWIADHRLGFAVYAVQALALQEGDEALLTLDLLALKHANKPKNVGEAATSAFADAAARQGISPDELRERIVPWLGFAPNAPRAFDCGDKRLEVYIAPDFTLGFRDAKTGKPAKSLPKTATPEIQEEMKELKALLKDAARAQSARLENLMALGKSWPAADWRERYLGHPLLRPFAARLVFGSYAATSTPLVTFRAGPAGTLVDRAGEAVSLPADLQVRIVHPLDLSDDERADWQAALTAAKVEQPFAQLDRTILRLPPGQADMDAFLGCHGMQVDVGRVKGATSRLGWMRGDASGGMIESYVKRYPWADLTALLHLDGMPVVLDLGTVATLGQLRFRRGSDRSTYLRLGDIPPRVLSEVLAECQQIAGQTLPDPQAGV